MTEFDATSGPVPRSDAERAAAFDELMRLERRQNKAPVSGLAVAGLGFGLVFVALMFFWGFALVIGVSALVFTVFALPQIMHGDRRGLAIVIVDVLVIAAGVWIMLVMLDQLFAG